MSSAMSRDSNSKLIRHTPTSPLGPQKKCLVSSRIRSLQINTHRFKFVNFLNSAGISRDCFHQSKSIPKTSNHTDRHKPHSLNSSPKSLFPPSISRVSISATVQNQIFHTKSENPTRKIQTLFDCTDYRSGWSLISDRTLESFADFLVRWELSMGFLKTILFTVKRLDLS